MTLSRPGEMAFFLMVCFFLPSFQVELIDHPGGLRVLVFVTLGDLIWIGWEGLVDNQTQMLVDLAWVL